MWDTWPRSSVFWADAPRFSAYLSLRIRTSPSQLLDTNLSFPLLVVLNSGVPTRGMRPSKKDFVTGETESTLSSRWSSALWSLRYWCSSYISSGWLRYEIYQRQHDCDNFSFTFHSVLCSGVNSFTRAKCNEILGATAAQVIYLTARNVDTNTLELSDILLYSW